MLDLLKPGMLARTYRDPVAWAILAVDLFPIWAVLTMGWGAAAIVMLYWLENLIVGAVALARMTASSLRFGAAGLLGMFFIGPFFVFHYGMFCFVHGVFLQAFAAMGRGGGMDGGFPTPVGLIDAALSAGANMPTFVLAIILLQGFLFVRDFILSGQFRESDVGLEMGKPYGRIVVLHVGIFAGAGAMAFLGEPLWGVVGLILLRTVWGVALTVRRRLQLDGDLPKQKVDASS